MPPVEATGSPGAKARTGGLGVLNSSQAMSLWEADRMLLRGADDCAAVLQGSRVMVCEAMRGRLCPYKGDMLCNHPLGAGAGCKCATHCRQHAPG